MLEVKLSKEGLKELLKDVLEFLEEEVEYEDCLLEGTGRSAWLNICYRSVYAECIEDIDYFSGPVERTYTYYINASIEVDGADQKKAEELLDYIIDRNPLLEDIRLYPRDIEKILSFLDEGEDDIVRLVFSKFAESIYIISGDRILKMEK